jgi:phosphatidylglycerophosphatase A|tara:strand:+ start:597 stop:893 length:297 start_codon:yes stop_codon:yes gene_type:complete
MILGTIAAEVAVLELESDDPSWIVVDEWAGMWLSMVAIQGASGWMLAFFLFRTFDILKPFPAGRFEQLQGGVGIMADDVVAAGYTQVAVHAALWAFGI